VRCFLRSKTGKFNNHIYIVLFFGFAMNTNGKAKGPNKAPITTQNGTAALRFLATE